MIEAYPYVPLRADMRTAVVRVDGHGRLGFGITGDYDTTGDLDVLCDGIGEGFGQLLASLDGSEATSAPTGA